jgi:hypothetical protein
MSVKNYTNEASLWQIDSEIIFSNHMMDLKKECEKQDNFILNEFPDTIPTEFELDQLEIQLNYLTRNHEKPNKFEIASEFLSKYKDL